MSSKRASEQQATKLAAVVVEHHNVFTTGFSEDIQWAISNPSDAISLFVLALKSRTKEVAEEVKEVVKRVLTPFITIETGGTTTDKLVADIKANKNENDVADEVSGYAGSMMANKAFTISKEKGKADLVALSLAELGFTKQPRRDEFMTDEFCAQFSAKYLDGYVIELCQPEDGPQLRKQWKDQPKDTAVWMAMKPISDSVGDPHVFCVECRSDGNRWLRGSWVRPGRRFVQGNQIVFRLRKI